MKPSNNTKAGAVKAAPKVPAHTRIAAAELALSPLWETILTPVEQAGIQALLMLLQALIAKQNPKPSPAPPPSS
jgi:hypothetical protein